MINLQCFRLILTSLIICSMILVGSLNYVNGDYLQTIINMLVIIIIHQMENPYER